MTQEELLTLAREVLANKTRSHVEAARVLAQHIIENEANRVAAPMLDAVMQAKLDAVYRERDMLVALVAKLTPFWPRGGRAGLKQHPEDATWDPEWRTIVMVDLDGCGQLSWHVHASERRWFPLPPFAGEWDGHTTEEKYERIRAFVSA